MSVPNANLCTPITFAWPGSSSDYASRLLQIKQKILDCVNNIFAEKEEESIPKSVLLKRLQERTIMPILFPMNFDVHLKLFSISILANCFNHSCFSKRQLIINLKRCFLKKTYKQPRGGPLDEAASLLHETLLSGSDLRVARQLVCEAINRECIYIQEHLLRHNHLQNAIKFILKLSPPSSHPALLMGQDDHGCLPLHYAILTQNPTIIKRVLDGLGNRRKEAILHEPSSDYPYSPLTCAFQAIPNKLNRFAHYPYQNGNVLCTKTSQTRETLASTSFKRHLDISTSILRVLLDHLNRDELLTALNSRGKGGHCLLKTILKVGVHGLDQLRAFFHRTSTSAPEKLFARFIYNIRFEEGKTLLHQVADYRNVDLIKYLSKELGEAQIFHLAQICDWSPQRIVPLQLMIQPFQPKEILSTTLSYISKASRLENSEESRKYYERCKLNNVSFREREELRNKKMIQSLRKIELISLSTLILPLLSQVVNKLALSHIQTNPLQYILSYPKLSEFYHYLFSLLHTTLRKNTVSGDKGIRDLKKLIGLTARAGSLCKINEKNIKYTDRHYGLPLGGLDDFLTELDLAIQKVTILYADLLQRVALDFFSKTNSSLFDIPTGVCLQKTTNVKNSNSFSKNEITKLAKWTYSRIFSYLKKYSKEIVKDLEENSSVLTANLLFKHILVAIHLPNLKRSRRSSSREKIKTVYPSSEKLKENALQLVGLQTLSGKRYFITRVSKYSKYGVSYNNNVSDPLHYGWITVPDEIIELLKLIKGVIIKETCSNTDLKYVYPHHELLKRLPHVMATPLVSESEEELVVKPSAQQRKRCPTEHSKKLLIKRLEGLDHAKTGIKEGFKMHTKTKFDKAKKLASEIVAALVQPAHAISKTVFKIAEGADAAVEACAAFFGIIEEIESLESLEKKINKVLGKWRTEYYFEIADNYIHDSSDAREKFEYFTFILCIRSRGSRG